jgi:hypothetical protein
MSSSQNQGSVAFLSLGMFLVAICAAGCGGGSSGGTGGSGSGGSATGGSGTGGSDSGGATATGGAAATAGAGGHGGGTAGAAGGGATGAAGGRGGGTGTGGAGAPGVSCPSAAPADGAPCDRAGRCTYLDCAGSGRVSAVCDGQRFNVESFPCNMTVTQCGGSTCATDMLCVEELSGVAMRHCVANPCGTGAITCDCAGSLCPRDWSCSAITTTITCQSPCTKGCP